MASDSSTTPTASRHWALVLPKIMLALALLISRSSNKFGADAFSPNVMTRSSFNSIGTSSSLSLSINRQIMNIPTVASASKRSHRSSNLFAEGSNDNNNNSINKQEKESENKTPPPAAAVEVTPETIAEMIEVSFLQSCLQLSQGYVDVLKLFIVAVQAGYERQLPFETVVQLVEDCPVNSAGRELMKEEKELRREWMMVVYEMLRNFESGGTAAAATTVVSMEGSASSSSEERVAQVVSAMLSIQQELKSEEVSSGGVKDAIVALSNLTVEQAIQRSSDLSQFNDSLLASGDSMGKAFLTNDLRLALLTCRVMEEEKDCLEGSSGGSSRGIGTNGEGEVVPRPPIPGT